MLAAHRPSSGVAPALIIMFLMAAIARVCNGSMTANDIKVHLGLNSIELGIVLASFGLPYTAVLSMGALKRSRAAQRIIAPVGCVLVAALMLVYAVTHSFGTIVVTGVVLAIASVIVAELVLSLGKVPDQTERVRLSQMTGLIAAPCLTSLATSDGAATLLQAGFMALLWTGGLAVLFRDAPKTLVAHGPRNITGNETFAASPGLHILDFSKFCYAWTAWSFIDWLPVYAIQEGLGRPDALALIACGLFVSGFLGNLAGGRLTTLAFRTSRSRVSARAKVATSALLMAAISGLLAVWVEGTALRLGVLCTAYFFLECANPIRTLIASDATCDSTDDAPWSLGKSFGVAALLVPLAGGFAIEQSSIVNVYAIALCSTIAGSVVSGICLLVHGGQTRGARD